MLITICGLTQIKPLTTG